MIDTHCHLTDPPLDAQIDAVIDRAEVAGVKQIILPGTSVLSSKQGIELSSRYSNLYAAVGIHPEVAHEENSSQIDELLKKFPRIVAVGEVGLDYYRLEGEQIELKKITQQALFAEMLQLAERYQKPMIIHTRAAHTDTLAQLARASVPILIHSFSGNSSEAAEFLARGYYLGLNGIITFKKNETLRQVVREIPLERIVLETDAPFLSPEGFRGQPNEPARVRVVATCLAELKVLTVDAIDQVTTNNATHFFNLGR